MPKINRILLSVFIVLSLVTALEVTYLVAVGRRKTISQDLNVSQALPTNSKTAPSRAPKTWFAVSSQTRDIFVERTATIKKGLLTKLIASSEIEGNVSKINTAGWTMPNGVYYKYSFQLTDPLTKNSNFLMFQEEELKKMKIVLLEDGKEQPLNFKDIKTGDFVKIKHTVNLLEKDYFAGVESIIIEISREQTK